MPPDLVLKLWMCKVSAIMGAATSVRACLLLSLPEFSRGEKAASQPWTPSKNNCDSLHRASIAHHGRRISHPGPTMETILLQWLCSVAYHTGNMKILVTKFSIGPHPGSTLKAPSLAI
jgi:hypothetical protein